MVKFLLTRKTLLICGLALFVIGCVLAVSAVLHSTPPSSLAMTLAGLGVGVLLAYYCTRPLKAG